MANKRWQHKLSDDKIKERQDNISRPVNYELVIALRVNPEIWQSSRLGLEETILSLPNCKEPFCKIATCSVIFQRLQ